MPVIDFHPRPDKYRKVKPTHTNGLLKDLQSISTGSDDSSMWESQLQFCYEDYALDDVNMAVINEKIKILYQNLTVSEVSMQLPGTEGQSQSEKWFSERWLRLTASKCLPEFRIGKLVKAEAPNAAVKAFKFIKTKVWQINGGPFQSYWMKYGIESEPEAIKKYEEQTNSVVATSGL